MREVLNIEVRDICSNIQSLLISGFKESSTMTEALVPLIQLTLV